MTLKILQIGHPTLRQQARELTHEEILSTEIQQLITIMKEIMYEAPGVGLAAPQIGLPIQLAVIEDRELYLRNLTQAQLKERDRKVVPFQVIINPKITIQHPNETAAFYEGCLSVSPFIGKVTRGLAVSVECLNERAEPVRINATGWHARILQHEIDHLHGILCVDRMDIKTLSTIENYQLFPR